MSIILTCNAGSTNTKLAVFDAVTLKREAYTVKYDSAQIVEWVCSIGEKDIVGVSHRIVHGGHEFTQPEELNKRTLARLAGYNPLAPLHQPVALELVKEVQRLYPHVPHVGCFDTAFHCTMPDIEKRLPLPRRFAKEGLMRYGFHGLSYQYITEKLPYYAGERARGRVIAAHLGGGSSACGMQDLRSVTTTMGFSTLDGLMMGTRCGALDPGVILYLLQEKEMPVQEVVDLLYQDSGLKGVSGISGDIRDLQASSESQASEAIELYCHTAARQIASLIPSLGGMDILVFTGGIGENSSMVREKIIRSLQWLGGFSVYVIPTDEERVMARACQNYLAGESHAKAAS